MAGARRIETVFIEVEGGCIGLAMIERLVEVEGYLSANPKAGEAMIPELARLGPSFTRAR